MTRKVLGWLLRVGGLLFVAICVVALVGFLYLQWVVLPPLDGEIAHLKEYKPPSTVQVLDKSGHQIDMFYLERRFWVDYEDLPKAVPDAFVAAEDRRFREHPGIDPFGIARAVQRNFEAGHVVEGGSTLTQQLIKNLLVGSEKSYTRKAHEALAALRLEALMSKEEILELYLNFVYLGSGNYGVEAAARDYFGVSASELNAGQAALLAGLVPAPSKYNPRRNPERASMRRTLVLRTMEEEKFISKEEYERFIALDELASVLPNVPIMGPTSPTSTRGTAYRTMVRRHMRELFGREAPFEGGYRVTTAYDPDVQEVAENAIHEAVWAVTKRQAGRDGRPKLDEISRPFIEGAAVVLENRTGNIVAMVGGYEVALEGFVRATQGRRQPGSAFKPIVYAEALSQGHSQLDYMMDAPLYLPGGPGGRMWSPKNYSKGYSGKMTINSALTHSVNTVAVRLAVEAGVDNIVNRAKAMGVNTPLRHDLSISLGSSEVTVMDLATAYATIARYGERATPVYITELHDVYTQKAHFPGDKVELPDGSFVTLPGGRGEQALREGVAFEMMQMMSDVVRRGTGRRAYVKYQDRGGKTGTTSSYHDAWFVGYTPRHTVAVWIGTDDYTTLGDRETGSRAALPAWRTIVNSLGVPESAEEAERFVAPDDAVMVPWAGRWMGIARGHYNDLDNLPPKPKGMEPLPSFPGIEKVGVQEEE